MEQDFNAFRAQQLWVSRHLVITPVTWLSPLQYCNAFRAQQLWVSRHLVITPVTWLSPLQQLWLRP